MRKYKLIGLTGPTGAGKSTFCNILKENNDVKIIDTDKISRQATVKDGGCYATLCAVFGEEIKDENKEINRQKLANIAFATKENTQKLNDIVHPWVFLKTYEMIKKYSEQNAKYIFIDAPVLIESNANYICDEVVSVLCPLEIRIKRIMKRDNISKENAIIRIKAQQEDEFYIKNSDYIIDGSLTELKTREEGEKLIKKLSEGLCFE